MLVGRFPCRLAEIKLLLTCLWCQLLERLSAIAAVSAAVSSLPPAIVWPLNVFLVFDHGTLLLIRLLGPAFINVAVLVFLDFPCCGFVCLFYSFVIQTAQKPGMEQRAGNSFRLWAGTYWNWKIWQSMQGCPHIKTALFPFPGSSSGELFPSKKIKGA